MKNKEVGERGERWEGKGEKVGRGDETDGCEVIGSSTFVKFHFQSSAHR